MSEPLPLAAAQRRRGKPGRPRKPDAEMDPLVRQVVEKLGLQTIVTVAPRLLGEEDAGRYLGISRWSIRSLIDAGKLQPVTLPGTVGDMRRVLLDRDDLDALVVACKGRPA